jgi:gluconolactonase
MKLPCIILSLAALFALSVSRAGAAEDWGAYALVPASAPSFVLEVVGSGTSDGTLVSIAPPRGTANQKWLFVPKVGNLFAIRPAYSTTLVLAAAQGGASNGTQAMLETDRNQPWQQWEIRQGDGGTYSLVAPHAPDKGLDHFGGVPKAGTRIDLWTNTPGDTHLQWLIKPLAGTGVGPAAAPESSYIPPEIKPEDVPKGEVKTFTFSSSAIFPGTVREVAVFIPAQYDGAKPACVYVKTDGYNPREKELLETMIATREMPVMIGVFVRPGDVPAPMKGTLGRRNRSFEYDGLGDNNVRFLNEELLPDIERRFKLKLSTNGNDRCIAGGSSGGIAAFNSAWERPDLFSRVYANSGSFVAFRGGHEFPTLVRKFEPKPIRAYLTTGTHDMENAAGDWFLLNQEMDKALKFSGYDYVFRIINGGHVAGYYDYWREAMSYLWKGWPQPVQAGSGAPRVRDVLLPGEPWKYEAGSLMHPAGAACAPGGLVLYSEVGASDFRATGDGKWDKGFKLPRLNDANGMAFGADGRLYTVSEKSGKVMCYAPDGKAAIVASGLRGHSILAMPSGGLYVTANGDKENSGEVWYLKDGKKKLVASGLKRATGLALRPDQWLLAVADGRSKWVYSFQIEPDGALSNKERYFWLHVPDGEDDAGAESICYAKEGQMFVATRLGVQVCADDGATQVILPLPENRPAMSVCLGGKEMDTLFVLTPNRVYSRKVKVHGIGAFSPWTKVNGSPL